MNIDKLLTDNGLCRKSIPEGPNSLMRAISDTLYFTTAHYEQISTQLVQFLKKLLFQNQVPASLSILETNLALQQDYCSHPNFMGFDKINMELVSLMFKVKVVIYGISDDEWLCARIINKNYNKTIELFKHNNHYDSVYSRDYLEKANMVQQILYQTLGDALKFQTKVPKQYRNIEHELWMEERIAQQIENLKTKTQGRQRSLSDQFNNDSEKMDELFTNLEEKLSKMFSNNSNPPKTAEKKGQLDLEYAQNQMNQILKIQAEMEQGRTPQKSGGQFQITENHLQSQQSEQIRNIRGNPPGINVPKPVIPNLSNTETPKKPPVIIDESEIRYTGRLKFFDEGKNYGFIVLDNDNSDIFVHADDLQKVGITKEFLRNQGCQYRSQTGVSHFGKGQGKAPKFSFSIMVYVGKYNKSRKAVDLKFLND